MPRCVAPPRSKTTHVVHGIAVAFDAFPGGVHVPAGNLLSQSNLGSAPSKHFAWATELLDAFVHLPHGAHTSIERSLSPRDVLLRNVSLPDFTGAKHKFLSRIEPLLRPAIRLTTEEFSQHHSSHVLCTKRSCMPSRPDRRRASCRQRQRCQKLVQVRHSVEDHQQYLRVTMPARNTRIVYTRCNICKVNLSNWSFYILPILKKSRTHFAIVCKI